MTLSHPPAQAWQRLPSSAWNADTARHLLRRAGWSARPADVDRATREGLDATLERLFPAEPELLPKPAAIERLQRESPALQRELRGKHGEERFLAARKIQERQRLALEDLSNQWLQFAASPRTASAAKWTLFLSDVYVVSAAKVHFAPLIYEHFDILARHSMGSAPVLSRAVSRSPAMVMYLDLNQSRREAPNENFARELFELFLLGEGNYTEHDIKESARAFTGYRALPALGEFRYVRAQHDPTLKTVFGVTGHLTGDDVIDLAYRQPAAASFLPHEMVKFYLCDDPLPAEYLATLGASWRENGFNLHWLTHQFFGSQIFYAKEFRANFIKSPIQFYLGMVQDLGLEVSPLARMNIFPLRQMGQWLFFPPNVRGWVGGRRWINSATLTARRHLVEMTFAPIREGVLNADELLELVAARSNGITRFTVSDAELESYTALPAPDAAAKMAADFLPVPASPQLRAVLADFLATTRFETARHRFTVRRAAATLLQSPEYQLC